MQYQITHTTEYEYHHSVSICHNVAKLLLRDTNNQLCKKTVVKISPQPEIINEYKDFFGNKVMYFAIQQEHKHLKVTVLSQVEKKKESNNTLGFFTTTPWEEIKHQILEPGDDNFDARQFISETDITKTTEDILQYTLKSFTAKRSMLYATQELMQRIHTDFEFKPGFTTVATPLKDVMKQRKGVCQDFAHLAIACIRSIGLPARYVSGYIETVAPEGKEKLVGVDASHAWFAVYIPGAGWLDFDPTNNIIPSEQHITIGWGRDYTDITPLKGVILSSGPHQLHVSVDVRRID
jgi:transglutaminase-like putative cysteine protease